MAGMSSLTGAAISSEFRGSCGNNLTGAVYNQVSNSLDIRKSQSYSTSVGNTTTGGADEIFSFQQSISAGSSFSLDLTAMTNLLQQASVSLARIKAIHIRLLSASDDSTINPAPVATSTVTVTNINIAVPNPFDFGNGGSGATVALTAGAGAVTAVALGAGGSGYPASTFFLMVAQQAGGSGNVFLAGTNASGVITSMTFIAGTGGSGYSTATVPAIVAGQYNILTGGAHLAFDPAANGMAAVSATSKGVKFINMDTVNGITVELSFFACTT